MRFAFVAVFGAGNEVGIDENFSVGYKGEISFCIYIYPLENRLQLPPATYASYYAHRIKDNALTTIRTMPVETYFLAVWQDVESPS